jgi:His-Xaa-Ser system radical SAM maturase HxsB
LLAIKLRTRMRHLPESTGLHIFVVTLRCEHTCRYCQVSRQSAAKNEFDMTEQTARRALELAFRSPSSHLKIEFQGGEPLLNFPLVRWITAEAKRMNEAHGKDLAFVIATNLALLDDEILDFCADQGVDISTSLDGPQDLHNGNRRRPGQDSWQQAVAGIERVQRRLGTERISALMTTTEASLDRAAEIIDCYANLGLRGVFLRPISPYGFALRRRGGANYDVRRWLEFYTAGLDRIIELNRVGVPMVEIYASIIARKMLTNADPGYIDLASPAGIGIGAMVYNHDGDIYASDEGRMLAEMGDHTFRLGNVHESEYADVLLSDGLLRPLMESLTLSVPMCSTCAFEPYCGADPVFHHATAGDFVGHKALSAFCQRNTGVFTLLLSRMRDDPYARDLIRRWARQC